MRVYRDLELVEQLGSGVPGILESYGKECFLFMENFTSRTFEFVGTNNSGQSVNVTEGRFDILY